MMKVSELEGAELDYWVAKAEKLPIYYWNKIAYIDAGDPFEVCHGELREIVENGQACVPSIYDFTDDWEHAGPIIEREKICIEVMTLGGCKHWAAKKYYGGDNDSYCYHEIGPNPLIAAMRCYVASVYGDEVELLENN